MGMGGARMGCGEGWEGGFPRGGCPPRVGGALPRRGGWCGLNWTSSGFIRQGVGPVSYSLSSRSILSIFVSCLDSRQVRVKDGPLLFVSLHSECVQGGVVRAMTLVVWCFPSIAFLRVSWSFHPVGFLLIVAAQLSVWLCLTVCRSDSDSDVHATIPSALVVVPFL